MKKRKISVIVPIYNVEKYLVKCIESIINQDYKNLEIILIDDGSIDSSGTIVDKYKRQDKRIIAIHQSNKGLSNTRNVGIKKATGDYISFIDGDDYLDRDYYSTLINHIKNQDMIVFGYKQVNYEGKCLSENKLKHADFSKFRFVSACTKMYKRSFLVDNNILFYNVKPAEDAIFMSKCYSKTNKIEVIDYIGYNYVVNLSSITHTKENKKNIPINEILDKIMENINSILQWNSVTHVSYFCQKTFLFLVIEKSKTMEYSEMKKEYDQSLQHFLNLMGQNKLKMRITPINGDTLRNSLVINFYTILYKLKLDYLFLKLLEKTQYKK